MSSAARPNKQTSERERTPHPIDEALLRAWALPSPDQDGDKDDRGRVLIVGGARAMPGAVILAGTAALRAGAGKLQLATCAAVAPQVAASVPESYVHYLPDTASGGIDPSAAARVGEALPTADALLIGPGMVDDHAVLTLVLAILAHIEQTILVLDAAALSCLTTHAADLQRLGGRVIVTPHAGEMAQCLGVTKDEVRQEPLAMARRAAQRWQAIVVLKGAQTYIAAPEGRAYCYRGGSVGLATSGSGDTLAGVVAGLAARGADPLQAAVWAVYLHGSAGARLAQRMGPLGFLARELLAELPPLMASLAAEQQR